MSRKILDVAPEVEDVIITSTSYDGKHVLEFNETKHRYKLNGVRVKGVTTVGEVYPKGEGLIKWMIQQGIDEYTNKTAMKRGGDIGTVLHLYAENFEKKIPFDESLITQSPFEREIRNCIYQFLLWRNENQDEVIETESIVASVPLNAGGKIDTLRDREGLGLVLSDYKTSKDIYVTQLIQVIGGYRRMYREWKNMDIPYVEIVTFPKTIEGTMHVLLADKNGWVKDGVRTDIPDLFQKVEDQYERNNGTYLFRAEVENKLNPYKPKPKAEEL